MNFEIFNQLLVNSLVAGSVYALVASSFFIIYSTNKFIHMAHSSVITIGAYSLYFFFTVLDINFLLSLILTFGTSIILGLLIHSFYQQFRRKKYTILTLMLASIALMIFLDSMVQILFNGALKTYGLVKVTHGYSLFGAFITPVQIISILSSLLFLYAVSNFYKRNNLGLKIRAIADNTDLAEIIGISAEKVHLLSFLLGGVIASLAGIFYGLEYNLSPNMGTKLIFTGFASVLVGGLGSIQGAIFGAFLIGIIENFGIWFFSAAYKDSISFIVLFLILIFKPQGIFGFKNRLSI